MKRYALVLSRPMRSERAYTYPIVLEKVPKKFEEFEQESKYIVDK